MSVISQRSSLWKYYPGYSNGKLSLRISGSHIHNYCKSSALGLLVEQSLSHRVLYCSDSSPVTTMKLTGATE